MFLLSCSFGPSPEECTKDQECRDAFGLGATCADDGLCKLPKKNPRCENTYPADLLRRPERHSRDLIIGTLFDLSTDQPQVQAAELAAMQVNDNASSVDWLNGRHIGVVHCTYETDLGLDTLDYPDAAAESANYLIDVIGVSALIGPSTSAQSEVVYPIVEAADVLMISPGATSVYLNSIDGSVSTDEAPGLFWRTVPPDNLQGFSIANDASERGVSELAVVHHVGSYGAGLAEVTIQEFERVGGNVRQFTFENPSQLTDAIVDAARTEGIQEVLFISSEIVDIVAFLDGAEGIDEYTDPVDPLEIFLTDAAADPILLSETSGALDAQIRGTRPKVPESAEYEVFSVAYSIAYDQDAGLAVFAPFSYDATMLALYGAAWAHYNETELTGTNVARGLRRVSNTSLPEFGIRGTRYGEGTEAFAGGETLNLIGASGALDFDDVTGETDNPIEVWTINASRDDFTPVRVCEPGGICSDV